MMSTRLCVQRLISWRCLQPRAFKITSEAYRGFSTSSLLPHSKDVAQLLVKDRHTSISHRWGSFGSTLSQSRTLPLILNKIKFYSSGSATTSGSEGGGGGGGGSGEMKEGKSERHPDAEKEPLPEWPDGINPHTGERGGPKGPEPTRYGDWERKGRVSDF